MSILRRSSESAASLIPPRPAYRSGRVAVTSRLAMQQSVIWAAMNLHAAIESMMPIDVFGYSGGVKVNKPTPPILVSPSSFADGHPDTISQWLYARRMALQGWGNAFGEITLFNNYQQPLQIQLVPAEDVTCKISNHRIVEYRFGRTVMEPRKVFHSRDNLLPGIPVGLSPIAYAMLALETSASAQKFSADWFGNSATPGGHMKNSDRTLTEKQTRNISAKFKTTQEAGGLLVTGSDWTFTPMQAKAAEAGFIESMNYTDVQLCRFMNTPANVIDVSVQGGATVQYQNITQKNLDFMVSRMGPNLKQTDDDLTSLTPKPWFARLTREAFLAMDPVTRAELMKVQLESRQRTATEVRLVDDHQPYTEADYAEFDRLYGSKNQNPAPKGLPA